MRHRGDQQERGHAAGERHLEQDSGGSGTGAGRSLQERSGDRCGEPVAKDQDGGTLNGVEQPE